MLISDSHKLILMLPEKCATSTLEGRFRNIQHSQPRQSLSEYNKVLKKRLSKHVVLKDALRLEEFQKRNRHLKACFVRNPYDRIYSLFNWVVENNSEEMALIEAGEPVRGVAPEMKKDYARKAKRIITRRRKLEKIDFDFNRYLPRKKKRIRKLSLYTHLGGKNYMDFIGRVENFETDFAMLCSKIGYEGSDQSNHNVLHPATLNEAAEPDQPIHLAKYSPKSISIVNRICAEDFENFGYFRISP